MYSTWYTEIKNRRAFVYFALNLFVVSENISLHSVWIIACKISVFLTFVVCHLIFLSVAFLADSFGLAMQ